MKLFSGIVAVVFFLGQASAFSPLYDELYDVKSDLTQQVEKSSELLIDDVADFKQRTLQIDSYNNLVCLGLGSVSVDVDDVAILTELLKQRIDDRAAELTNAIELAESDNSLDDSPVVQLQYFNLLDTDIDTFDDSYQSYLNTLSTDLRTTLVDDETRFAQLAESNKIMLDELTTKRAYLATLHNKFDVFSDQLDLWDTFWTRQIEDVSLKDVVSNQLLATLNAYFTQQHEQLTSLYPDLPYLISDLRSFEDDMRETLDHELDLLFDGYLGYYWIEDGESLLLDREEFMEAYYLDDGTMNCPVIVGGWHADLIDKISTELDEEQKLLAETLVFFDGFESDGASITLLSKQFDVWYGDFFANTVKGPYVTFKNKTLTQAQKDYQNEQQAIQNVTLPYTKAQLLQALTVAANNYSSTQVYHNLLETSLENIKNQLDGNLSEYQRALFTLLRDAITEYLAQ